MLDNAASRAPLATGHRRRQTPRLRLSRACMLIAARLNDCALRGNVRGASCAAPMSLNIADAVGHTATIRLTATAPWKNVLQDKLARVLASQPQQHALGMTNAISSSFHVPCNLLLLRSIHANTGRTCGESSWLVHAVRCPQLHSPILLW